MLFYESMVDRVQSFFSPDRIVDSLSGVGLWFGYHLDVFVHRFLPAAFQACKYEGWVVLHIRNVGSQDIDRIQQQLELMMVGSLVECDHSNRCRPCRRTTSERPRSWSPCASISSSPLGKSLFRPRFHRSWRIIRFSRSRRRGVTTRRSFLRSSPRVVCHHHCRRR